MICVGGCCLSGTKSARRRDGFVSVRGRFNGRLPVSSLSSGKVPADTVSLAGLDLRFKTLLAFNLIHRKMMSDTVRSLWQRTCLSTFHLSLHVQEQLPEWYHPGRCSEPNHRHSSRVSTTSGAVEFTGMLSTGHKDYLSRNSVALSVLDI